MNKIEIGDRVVVINDGKGWTRVNLGRTAIVTYINSLYGCNFQLYLKFDDNGDTSWLAYSDQIKLVAKRKCLIKMVKRDHK